MRLKANRNIGGVVQANIGQEFEVNNAMARDLIQQGVAEPVSSGAEVQALFEKQDAETMAMESEMATIERAESEMAYSEAVQKEVNRLDDERQQAFQKVKEQAKQQAEQKVQSTMQQQSQSAQSQESQFKGENKLNDQRF
jgi:hypothetical protein